MKARTLLFAILFLHIGFAAFSQANIRFGVLVGGVYTTQIHLYVPEFSAYNNSDNYKSGYVVGMASEIGVVKNISILFEPEVLKAGASNSVTKDLTYLNLPLELKFFSNKLISPFIGGYYSFLTSYRVKGESTGNKWIDQTNFATHYDMGLNLGFAIKVSSRISLNAKYIYGLVNSNTSNYYGKPAYPYDINPKDYCRGLSVYLTYFFTKQ